jgi:hypothetical protein
MIPAIFTVAVVQPVAIFMRTQVYFFNLNQNHHFASFFFGQYSSIVACGFTLHSWHRCFAAISLFALNLLQALHKGIQSPFSPICPDQSGKVVRFYSGNLHILLVAKFKIIKPPFQIFCVVWVHFKTSSNPEYSCPLQRTFTNRQPSFSSTCATRSSSAICLITLPPP